MKRRRRHHRKKNPANPGNPRRRRRRHARRHNPLFAKKHHRRHRRRRNPGLPPAVSAVIGVGVGAGAGCGVAFGLDKLGIGSPQIRSFGMLGGGLALAVVGAIMKSPAATGIGGGIATVGAARAFLPSGGAALPSGSPLRLFAKKKSIKGLGSGEGFGDGGDIDADDIELVELVEGPDDVDGAFDDVGYVEAADDVDGAFDEVGYVEAADDVDGAFDDV